MLSCLYKGIPFNNREVGYTEKQIKDLGRNRELLCPRCKGEVYYCGEGKIVSHFKHYKNPCDERQLGKYDIISQRHDQSVELFYQWLHRQFPDIQIVKDMYLNLDGTEQKADLYFEINQTKIAIEVQFKHKNFDELEEKCEFYQQFGIKDIWFFIKRGDFVPGTPYERHYFRRNNRELYYVNDENGVFTYFKGFKKEQFNAGGVPLKKYISYSCWLDDINISRDGTLVLPMWRELYTLKLKELRNALHKDIRKRKQFRDSVHQRLSRKLEYRQGREITSDNPILAELERLQRKAEHTVSTSEAVDNNENNSNHKNYVERIPEFKQNPNVIQLINVSMSRYVDDERELLTLDYGEYPRPEYQIFKVSDEGNAKIFICRSIQSEKWYEIKLFKNKVCHIKELIPK